METEHVPARIIFFPDFYGSKELHVCPSWTTFVYNDRQSVTKCCIGKTVMHCYDAKHFKSRVY